MNIYLISQDYNSGYDTYDSAVVAAENERQAQTTYPASNQCDQFWDEQLNAWFYKHINGSVIRDEFFSTWVTPDKVTVKFLGKAADDIEAGVICASFNAG